MKKYILAAVIGALLSCNTVFSQCCMENMSSTNPNCCQKNNTEVLNLKKQIFHKQQERALIYNALNLTDEQIEYCENLTAENQPIFEEKFNTFVKENYKLKSLEVANACSSDLKAQKKIVKNIKKDIDDTLKKENNDFKKCLTSLQKSKYKQIKKLEKHNLRRAMHQKDYYKSNPQMVPFGNRNSCDCQKGKKLK